MQYNKKLQYSHQKIKGTHKYIEVHRLDEE